MGEIVFPAGTKFQIVGISDAGRFIRIVEVKDGQRIK